MLPTGSRRATRSLRERPMSGEQGDWFGSNRAAGKLLHLPNL
jgi:hypothetical protein